MSIANQIILSQPFDIKDIFLPNANATCSNTPFKTYKRGIPIYLQGESANKFYYLAKGKVKISTYSTTGKEMTKRFVKAGEVFGEQGLLGKEKHGDFAFAVEEAAVHTVTVGEMQQLMQKTPALSLWMMKKVGNILLKTEERMEALVFETSRDRIIHFLRKLAIEKGIQIGYEILVKEWFTHQDIANLTATSRQTVTTILNELRSANLIYFTRNKMLVRDLDKLN